MAWSIWNSASKKLYLVCEIVQIKTYISEIFDIKLLSVFIAKILNYLLTYKTLKLLGQIVIWQTPAATSKIVFYLYRIHKTRYFQISNLCCRNSLSVVFSPPDDFCCWLAVSDDKNLPREQEPGYWATALLAILTLYISLFVSEESQYKGTQSLDKINLGLYLYCCPLSSADIIQKESREKGDTRSRSRMWTLCKQQFTYRGFFF